MKTIAIISQKGGAGKSTLALHLAVAAERRGKPSAVIDLDPQASATAWKDLRQSQFPAVVSAQAARLPQVLETAAAHGAAFAFIDTAPHSEGVALKAARVADLVMIPCRPAILDLRAISVTVDLVRLAHRPACIVFNAVPPRGSIGDQAETAVQSYGLTVSPARMSHRASYIHALTLGQTAQEFEPDGKAAAEIQHLYVWMCKQVGV